MAGDLFADAKPRPPIERRKWSDPTDEANRLLDLAPKISYRSGKILRAEAAEFADYHGRQIRRRAFVELRRRAEEWAADLPFESDPDGALCALGVLRDLVTVLDDRIADNGGVDTTRDPQS
jgi:hypothetical protein